jgi:hypothetical protein
MKKTSRDRMKNLHYNLNCKDNDELNENFIEKNDGYFNRFFYIIFIIWGLFCVLIGFIFLLYYLL